VTVEYPGGRILDHREIPAEQPLPVIGRYPHAAAASYPRDKWPQVWAELFGLYPDVIAAYSGQPQPGQRDKLRRFNELWVLTTPPFMQSYYRDLNHAFFDWLAGAN
jgi:hypothetical protein